MKKVVFLMLCLVLMLCMTACKSDGGVLLPETSSPATLYPTLAPSEDQVETGHTHTWVEATYENPKTCTTCGRTEGKPLVPGFELLGCDGESPGDISHEYWPKADASFADVFRII